MVHFLVQVNRSRKSGTITTPHKLSNDTWIMYSDGRIAFERHYSDNSYDARCRAVRNAIKEVDFELTKRNGTI
jgi:hypothetical protein